MVSSHGKRRPRVTAYRREADETSAKVWWHSDFAPAHTSRAFTTWRNDETT
jgi:hypothetical protein